MGFSSNWQLMQYTQKKQKQIDKENEKLDKEYQQGLKNSLLLDLKYQLNEYSKKNDIRRLYLEEVKNNILNDISHKNNELEYLENIYYKEVAKLERVYKKRQQLQNEDRDYQQKSKEKKFLVFRIIKSVICIIIFIIGVFFITITDIAKKS